MNKKRISQLVSIAIVFAIIITILPTFSAMAVQHSYGKGGYHKIPLGNHNTTIDITATFTHPTWVRYLDINDGEVWAGSFSAGYTHILKCNSRVYYVILYLDDDKFAWLNW